MPKSGAIGETKLCGRVAEIRPSTPTSTVVIEGTEPAAARSFTLRLPAKVPIPFAVGDVLSVLIKVRSIRIHRVVEGMIIAKDGTLLLGFSEDGDIRFAPGWGLTRGAVVSTGTPHMKGGARREERGVALGYLGKVARVQAAGWRKLSTPQGDFAVMGSAQSWTKGARPPDASSYSSFAVVRLLSR